MDTIRKDFQTLSRAIDVEAGIYEATITTETPDRAGDIVVAGGAHLAAYMRNPVVMFAHDYRQPPVARAIEITSAPHAKRIVARFQFPAHGESARADEIHALWHGGFLNAASIGFMPLKSESINPEDSSWRSPKRFLEWEMLEFSIVPIPMNAEALRLGLKSIQEALTQDTPTAPTPAEVREIVHSLKHVLTSLKEAIK